MNDTEHSDDRTRSFDAKSTFVLVESSPENICRIPPALAEFATHTESQEAVSLKERSLKISLGTARCYRVTRCLLPRAIKGVFSVSSKEPPLLTTELQVSLPVSNYGLSPA